MADLTEAARLHREAMSSASSFVAAAKPVCYVDSPLVAIDESAALVRRALDRAQQLNNGIFHKPVPELGPLPAPKSLVTAIPCPRPRPVSRRRVAATPQGRELDRPRGRRRRKGASWIVRGGKGRGDTAGCHVDRPRGSNVDREGTSIERAEPRFQRGSRFTPPLADEEPAPSHLWTKAAWDAIDPDKIDAKFGPASDARECCTIS